MRDGGSSEVEGGSGPYLGSRYLTPFSSPICLAHFHLFEFPCWSADLPHYSVIAPTPTCLSSHGEPILGILILSSMHMSNVMHNQRSSPSPADEGGMGGGGGNCDAHEQRHAQPAVKPVAGW